MSNIDYLRQRLDYDPDTGGLTWRHHEAMPKKWNTRWAGKKAFTSVGSHGYHQGFVDYKHHLAHRIAFAVYYGQWPSDMIDHINGKRADNRIANLREATAADNQHNRSKSKNNTSGFKGVTRIGSGWMAQIKINGKKHYLGTFTTPEGASVAYAAAANRMHGDFARIGQ